MSVETTSDIEGPQGADHPEQETRRSKKWLKITGIVVAVIHEVIGVEELVVEGKPLETVHFRLTSNVGEDGDDISGLFASDLWIGPVSGVTVKRTLNADVSAKTIVGNVGFKETYDLKAKSLEPIS